MLTRVQCYKCCASFGTKCRLCRFFFFFAGCIRATVFAWTVEGHFCF